MKIGTIKNSDLNAFRTEIERTDLDPRIVKKICDSVDIGGWFEKDSDGNLCVVDIRDPRNVSILNLENVAHENADKTISINGKCFQLEYIE